MINSSSSSVKKKSSSSSTKDEAKGEAIMICVDCSRWMERRDSPMFLEQKAAILYYCEQKFKYNPRTIIGVMGSGEVPFDFMDVIHCSPTKDLIEIKDALTGIPFYGHSKLNGAAGNAFIHLMLHCNDMQKRIVFFCGSFLYPRSLEATAEALKIQNIACDIINFGDPINDKRSTFDNFIRLADNDGNCNICHVPPESTVRYALCRSQIFIPRVGGARSGSAQSSSLPQHDNNKPIIVYLKASPSNDSKTDCPFCQTLLLTLEEKKLPYDQIFIDWHKKKPKWFLEVNPGETLPLIKFSDGRYVSNSEVILEMIEEMFPKHPLAADQSHLASLGLKIIPKIKVYLKTKDKDDIWLLREFKTLELHLEDSKPGPYMDGKAITTVDLSLAPKLYHLVSACKLTIPKDFPRLHEYSKRLFDLPSFMKTKPSIEDVVAGWCKRVNISKDDMPQ